MAAPLTSAPVATRLRRTFEREFGGQPRLFRAPGRVNLIGEHTDYNDGFVLPAALDLGVTTAIAPRPDRLLRAHSIAMAETVEFDLDDPEPTPRGGWSDHLHGVAVMLERAGHRLTGAELAIDADLPIGAGLSASAAFEVSTGFALAEISGARVGRVELAKICQRAENEFVGARCGIMDQFISCCATKGSALLLDCRSLAARPVVIDPRVRLMVCDTMVRHRLADGEYNTRREECERAVALLAARIEGATALRDVTMDALSDSRSLLPDVLFRRARHVVTENMRTLRAAAALEAGDVAECGRMMDLSHQSLRDDYEVSCPELDLMVELARDLPGVFGSRMMGGGFGGCTISLVDEDHAEEFSMAIARGYENAVGVAPTIIRCVPGQGAGPVDE